MARFTLGVSRDGATRDKGILYDRLRKDILHGRFRPNERLVEIDLAQTYEVSRTPVREALQRLSENGLVSRIKSGYVVREHTEEEINEIYEVRAALEGFAARLAAKRATDAELDEIKTTHDDYINWIVEKGREPQIAHNDLFHDLVIKASRNQRLADLIIANQSYSFIHRMSLFKNDEDIRISIEGHQELVNALLARDPEAAEQAAIEGVMSGLRRILRSGQA